MFKALEFADKNSDTAYRKDTVIHNPQIIRDIVKISGCRFKIVARPDVEAPEEEVSDPTSDLCWQKLQTSFRLHVF